MTDQAPESPPWPALIAMIRRDMAAPGAEVFPDQHDGGATVILPNGRTHWVPDRTWRKVMNLPPRHQAVDLPERQAPPPPPEPARAAPPPPAPPPVSPPPEPPRAAPPAPPARPAPRPAKAKPQVRQGGLF